MKYGRENIRALNDTLRTTLTGGAAVMTPGVASLGPEAIKRAVLAISVFKDFSDANDPHGEHDFGAIDIDGQKLFFKIDCFDPTMSFRADDPSDPDSSRRVLTLMLASEY